MTISHILMFIAGGLIASLLFYKKDRRPIQKRYMSSVLAFQFYHGVYYGQQGNAPSIENMDEVNKLGIHLSGMFKTSAELCLKELDEL